jgi:hypothetical protein
VTADVTGRVDVPHHLHHERTMILRQFLHTDPVVAASYVFG